MRMQAIMSETRRQMERSVPFAMEPVVYDFAINEQGTQAALLSGDDALMPAGYYTQQVPPLIRTEMPLLSPVRRAELERFTAACRSKPDYAGMIQTLVRSHAARRPGCRRGRRRTLRTCSITTASTACNTNRSGRIFVSGRIGLAQNRLPTTSLIEDAEADQIDERSSRRSVSSALAGWPRRVVSLAGGVGTRWTRGAGVVKALNPFCKLGGRYRNFIEVHLAKSLRVSRECGALLPHVITTSYLTHEAIAAHLAAEHNYGYPGPLLLSPGRSIGLRMIPMVRDLRFAWEEMPQQIAGRAGAEGARGPACGADPVGRKRRRRPPTTPTMCPCNACIRWGIGMRLPTCCATARSSA